MRKPSSRWRAGAAFSALILAAVSCGPASSLSSGGGRLQVFVSILPQKALTEQIAGPGVEVRVMVGPGESPATYDPSPRQMARLAKAKLVLVLGVPFERAWTPRLSEFGPGLLLRDVSQGIERLPIEGDHTHGAEEELDPHLWLDPLRLASIARNTAEALAEVDPAHAEDYARRAEQEQVGLAALDAELRALLEPIEGSTLLVFHPSWGYFTRRYGLEQLAIERDGKAPGPRGMVELLERARAEGARFVLVQRQFDSAAVRTMGEELGVPLLTGDPLAEDLPAELRRLARALSETPRQAAGGATGQKRQTTLR